MAESRTVITSLPKEVLGILTRIMYGLITAPLLIGFYLLCWIRVKLTALVYCNKNKSLLAGEDVMIMLGLDHVDSIINVILLTKDHFSLDAMKELFLSKVLNAKDTNARPRFPKFTRYVNLRAGYLMWTEESNFNVEDHIIPYHGQPPNDEEQLKMLITDLCNKPFPSLKSGWEIIVIPLEYSQSDVPQTCILFRVHHFITDGISVFRLIIEQMAGNHGAFQPILKRIQNKFKPIFNNTFLTMLVNLARIIYSYVSKKPHQSQDISNNVFIKDKTKIIELSDSRYVDWTSAIKLDTITSVRNATSATMNDVVMSCMAGAFRKSFMRHDICLPDFLTTVIPFSFQGPDDPVDTVNKSYAMVTSMPTGDMDCLQRLNVTKALMDELKCSPDNIINRWRKQYCANIIPYKKLRKMFESMNTNVLFSNMPGPTSKASFNGNIIESLFLMQLPCHRIGFEVFVFTYSGDVTVAVSVDKARVNSREDVRQLLDDFVEEVQKLYHSVVGSPTKPPSTAMEKKIN